MATIEGRMMIPTVKNMILATDPAVWLSKVTKILQFCWDERSLEDLPRRFELLWEEIKNTQVQYQHNALVGFVAYNCFLGERKELTKQFAICDEDMLIEGFREIPAWNELRLEPWEKGPGPLIDDLTHLDVVRLLLMAHGQFEPESSDLHNLPIFLGARLPAYSEYRQEQTIAMLLAMILDEFSGRVAMLPTPCETDREFELKWGHLYSKISEYRAMKKLRDQIVLTDV